MVENLLYAKMPPHLKKSINQAYLENGTYDQTVEHIEREMELNDSNVNTRMTQIQEVKMNVFEYRRYTLWHQKTDDTRFHKQKFSNRFTFLHNHFPSYKYLNFFHDFIGCQAVLA